jgi:hypothetical protein
MSYKYLAGRLIETQRSMIGEPAIRIARAVEGIDVTDDGAVRAIDGDGYEAVAELSDRYTDILGNAAADRLRAAADEFEADLLLPPALGGPEDPEITPQADVDEQPASGAAAGVADGGTVAVQPQSADTEPPADPDADSTDSSGPVSDPLTVDYTLASDVTEADYADTALDSIYLMPAGDDDWGTPVTVEAAVLDAITRATDIAAEDLDGAIDSIDPERLLPTLNDEHGETVSFGVASVTVTFHRSGSLAVH